MTFSQPIVLKATTTNILPDQGVCVVGVNDTLRLPHGLAESDEIARALKAANFKGSCNACVSLFALGRFQRVVVLGLGETAQLDEAKALDLGGAIVAHLENSGVEDAHVVCELSQELLASMAMGARLRAWRFDMYKQKPEGAPASLNQLSFYAQDTAGLQTQMDADVPVVESTLWARRLVNEPANALYPDTMVDELRALESLGLKVEVLDQDDMKRLGMGALLGVAQGSDKPPYLGIVRWQGGSEGAAPLAFVGKGVTFDSGGLSLKPAGSMPEMKGDMAGSAVVSGVLRTLAMRKAKVNAVGVVALVENMVSGNAQRPGDIVTSMSGQTIEVLNTDAEGRLILADALYYTHTVLKPQVMIDVATLTGAMRYALGPEYAGMFTPSDKIAAALEQAGREVGEPLWRLPLCEGFKKAMKGQVADLQNISAARYGAGSSTAAQFLHCFVGDTPWAHLDIANMDMLTKDTLVATAGGCAFALRLLDRWARRYEG